jgi:hypothetical protein
VFACECDESEEDQTLLIVGGDGDFSQFSHISDRQVDHRCVRFHFIDDKGQTGMPVGPLQISNGRGVAAANEEAVD